MGAAWTEERERVLNVDRKAARTPRGKNRGHAGLVVSAAAALRAARCTAAGDGAARRRIKRQLSWITTCVPSGDV